MKQTVLIKHQDKTLYMGKISDIPLKKEAIIKKSIALFDDEDPCIIHQSYVVKEYVDEILNLFNEKGTTLHIADYEQLTNILDVPSDATLILKG
ncbi:MAG: hypothetical protein K9L74_06425 [Candidatus Izimaplasma sp.]|nr:hypothetical protein [Candidatus Izimaplasma bacterium]